MLGITLGTQRQSIALADHYTILDDPTAALTFEAASGEAWDRFRPLDLENVNVGHSASAYWLRLPLTYARDDPQEWLLEIPLPTLDEVDVYLRAESDGALVTNYRAGDRRPFSDRPVRDAHLVFPLPLTPGENYHLFVRLRSEGNVSVDSFLWPRDLFYSHSKTHYMLLGLYLGVLIGLLAYNLLLLLSLCDRLYLFYVLFTLALVVTQASWDGITYEYLWQNSPEWADLAVFAGLNAAGFFAALFSRAFLDTRTRAPRLDIALLICAATFAGLLAGVTILPSQWLALLTSVAASIFSVVAVVCSAWCLRRGFRSARYFLAGWSVLSASTVIFWTSTATIAWNHELGVHGMQLGTIVALLLLSFALAERLSAVHRARDAAEAAVRAKDEFLATVSHEIRTPLTVLLGSVGLLLESGLQPRQSTLAASAKRSGEQLLSLLNDLIDLSRFVSGQLHLEKRAFEAGALVRDTVELMKVPAQDKGLSLRVRIDFERLYLIADPARIRQVLLNLLFNAVKFTDRGEVRIEASLIGRSASGRATIRFAVTDTGDGIKAADQERLFRPFSQVEKDHARRGSGLGLVISRSLVEAMGGTIRMFSRPGQGSRFWFDLDLAAAAETDAPSEHAAPARFSRLRLLLVEDVDESREVLTAQLEHAGHAVTAVHNGEAALTAVRHREFDAVLMDLQMPEMDGYTAAQRLRTLRSERELPVFALTANVTARTRAACTEAGMQGVIAKPLRTDELDAALFDLFGDRRFGGETHPGQASPLIDEAMLAERLSMLGVEGTAKVVAVFLEVVDQRAAALASACRNGDGEALSRAAHVLRGSAGAVGLTALLELTGKVEEKAHIEPAEACDLVDRLPLLLNSSVAALESWCATHGVAARSRPISNQAAG